MAISVFGIFGNWIKAVQKRAEDKAGTAVHAGRSTVVNHITYPTRSLIDRQNPHKYVKAVSTNVRRTWGWE